MELTGLNIQQQAATLAGAVGEAESLRPAETSAAAQPVLSGKNVKIRVPTDYEKLLAQLESESAEKSLETRKSCFSAALAILCGRHEAVSAAYEEVVQATDALTQASVVAAEAQAAFDASSALLATEKGKLEKMIEESSGTEEELARIEEQKQTVADLQKVVDADAQTLAAARSVEADAEALLESAVANLDSLLASDVLAAAEASARKLEAAAREQPDGEETVKKANELVKKLEAYVARLDEMKDDEIREALAKIVPDLVFLVTANYAVAPGDLPQYERRV